MPDTPRLRRIRPFGVLGPAYLVDWRGYALSRLSLAPALGFLAWLIAATMMPGVAAGGGGSVLFALCVASSLLLAMAAAALGRRDIGMRD